MTCAGCSGRFPIVTRCYSTDVIDLHRPCLPTPLQRDFGMECLLLRLVAMSPAECEAQLAQLLAGTGAAGPSL